MQLIIHRGSHEIGGSCVELIGKKNRILVDMGMPLVNAEGDRFDFKEYSDLSGPELVEKGILPDIRGAYYWDNENTYVDALLISHSHQDHYGFIKYLEPSIPVYVGKAAKELIDITILFSPLEGRIQNPKYINSGKSFDIGEFMVTPYLMDHSAFDAYAFLIETDDKSILYSGDFREHGRKSKAFYWFLHNTPDKIDALLLEGTSLGRNSQDFRTESEIENEMVSISQETKGIVLIQQSSQNIDRIVSFYRAAKKTNRQFIVDIYTAYLLDTLKEYADIPYTSLPNVGVFYPRWLCNIIAKKDNRDLLLKYRRNKIEKEDIANNSSNIMMLIRPSMLYDLKKIDSFDNACYVYSLWSGYLQEDNMMDVLSFIESKNIEFNKLHTSGHASISTLKKVIKKINPDKIIPIHTFYPERYKDFSNNIIDVTDGEVISI